SLFFRASPLLLTALWGVALSLPLTLLFWLLRRACYVDMHVDVAVRSSLLYAVLLLVGLLVLSWNDWVSSFNAFIVIGLASLGASVGARYWLLRRWKSAVHDASRVALPVVLKEHWSYGRWVLGASVAHSISSAIFAPLVASFLGLAQAGAFRAMQNLVAPIQQVMTAMGVLLLPWMSKKHAEQGGTSLKGSIFKASLLNTAAVLSFALILGLFSDQLITLLYDDAYYNAFRWLLPYMLGALLVVALSQPVAVASRAMEKPSALLWSKLSASLCLLLVGLPLIWLENMQGVVITLVLVAFAEAFVLFHFLKKHIFRKPSSRTG
ncbi:MAG: lipopolysaccharide biosynthesis protein, partial [Rhodothermales bacterium]